MKPQVRHSLFQSQNTLGLNNGFKIRSGAAVASKRTPQVSRLILKAYKDESSLDEYDFQSHFEAAALYVYLSSYFPTRVVCVFQPPTTTPTDVVYYYYSHAESVVNLNLNFFFYAGSYKPLRIIPFSCSNLNLIFLWERFLSLNTNIHI